MPTSARALLRARSAVAVLHAEARSLAHGDRDLASIPAATWRPSPQIRRTARRIELTREQLRRSQHQTRHGSVGETVGQISVRRGFGQALMQAVVTSGACSVVEMGTGVGVSGAYLASGIACLGGGRLITLDADADRAAKARSVFQDLELDHIVEVRIGRFEDTLQAALSDLAPVGLLYVDGHHDGEATVRYFERARPYLGNNALVVFDDIRWSAGMTAAWRRLGDNCQKLDVGRFGIVRV